MKLKTRMFIFAKHALHSLRVCACAAGMLTLVVASTASAEIAPEQAALGGITIDASSSYVRSIYGEGHISSISGGYEYQYNGASVLFWAEDYNITPRVKHVDTWKNNGFATPAGVTVGMNSSILNELYGAADLVSYKPWQPHYSNTVKCYIYDVAKTDFQTLTFFVDKNEQIIEIRLYRAE